MPGHCGMDDAAGDLRQVDDLHDERMSGFNSAAHVLAVYASRRGSPHAVQDSLLAAGQALPGRFDLPGPERGFSS